LVQLHAENDGAMNVLRNILEMQLSAASNCDIGTSVPVIAR